ncbi:unnamed protein product [Euphydryas editha]|nr:unnamed protein product [Euphydryas editha]
MPSAQEASPEQMALSKKVRKLIRRDLYQLNRRAITALIEQNRDQKFSRDNCGKSFLRNLKQWMAESLALALRPEKRSRNFMD